MDLPLGWLVDLGAIIIYIKVALIILLIIAMGLALLIGALVEMKVIPV